MFTVNHAGEGLKEKVLLADSDAGTSASIAVHFGFNCHSFICPFGGKHFDVLHAPREFPSPGDKATAFGTPILVPFPNRIREGKFAYAGKPYELPRNEHGKNAIHGFAVDLPWRVVDQGTGPGEGAWVTGEFRFPEETSKHRPELSELWPADFAVSFTYRLRGYALDTEIVVKNPDSKVLPFGVGTHPYFRFPLEKGAPLDSCEIVVPAAQQVLLENYLPTGKLQPVRGLGDLRRGLTLEKRTLDDVFTDLEPGPDGMVRHYLRDHGARVEFEMRHDASFPFAVVYTPPHRESICIEPYTCVTDAINLTGAEFDPGFWHLPPDSSKRLKLRYEVRAI